MMTYLEVKQELTKRGFEKIGARFVKEVDTRVIGLNMLSGDEIVTVDVHVLDGKYRIVLNYKGIRLWNHVRSFNSYVDIDFMLTHISHELGEYINDKAIGNIVGSLLTRRNR